MIQMTRCAFAVMLAGSLMMSVTAKCQYIATGKIEYERKINMYALVKDFEWNEWLEQLKKTTPQFNISYFDLSFDTAHSRYAPGREVEGQDFRPWLVGPAKENVVYTDFLTQRVTASKIVFEQTFLVADSMRKIDWTVKDEIRTIANFKCRKAVGRICDSVYVVAFYSEEILANGGPEMFGGLPGMIMELAIPRLHTTWTATKVELEPPVSTAFAIPAKGKKVSEKELYETVSGSFKDWGKSASRNIWWIAL